MNNLSRPAIIVKNTSEQDILKSLEDMGSMYYDTGLVNSIQLSRFKGDPTAYHIEFELIPEFLYFCYFVNYLTYPIGIENDQIKVYGLLDFETDMEGFDFRDGENIGFFINSDDTDYTNVSCVNAKGKCFRYTFDFQVDKLDRAEISYQKIVSEFKETVFMQTIYPQPKPLSVPTKSWWKFW